MHMPQERTTRHSHYNLNYHFVFTPKYRRHLFHGAVREKFGVIKRYIQGQRKHQVDDDA
ncbi:transposase [Thermus scotoductus]|uniref:transposase n=2 Tax=Thermus scotoductus TaxID=37636 RepID=UPI0026AFE616